MQLDAAFVVRSMGSERELEPRSSSDQSQRRFASSARRGRIGRRPRRKIPDRRFHSPFRAGEQLRGRLRHPVERLPSDAARYVHRARSVGTATCPVHARRIGGGCGAACAGGRIGCGSILRGPDEARCDPAFVRLEQRGRGQRAQSRIRRALDIGSGQHSGDAVSRPFL